MIEVKVSFDHDAERALNDTHHWAALALSPDEKTGVEDPIEMERLADALPVERSAKRFIVSTDPDEHVAKIQEYIDMGFKHLVFHGPARTSPGSSRPTARRSCPGCARRTGAEYSFRGTR